MFDLNISPEQKRALTILATLCLGVGGIKAISNHCREMVLRLIIQVLL
jgi:hypothetical protein